MRCISPVFVRRTRLSVPCGKCNFCLALRRADWTFRLKQELKISSSASFVTLTYDEENLVFADDGPTLCKSDLQLFFKRLRKKEKKGIRYYAVGEYGTETSRPHYHIILFNASSSKVVEDSWKVDGKPIGMTHIGLVTPASIHYVTKYVINRVCDYGLRAPPFQVMSRNPGIGDNYRITHFEYHRKSMKNYTSVNGIVARLPRFYKDHFFTSKERQRFYEEAIVLNDVEYAKEIDRLTKFHSDPYHYFDERERVAHEKIFSKVNSLNKF